MIARIHCWRLDNTCWPVCRRALLYLDEYHASMTTDDNPSVTAQQQRAQRAAKALSEAVTALMNAVGKAGKAKKEADEAREQHVSNVFDFARSHRAAEAAAHTTLDKAIATCADALAHGVTLNE